MSNAAKCLFNTISVPSTDDPQVTSVQPGRFYHVSHELVPSLTDPRRHIYVLRTWDSDSKPVRFEPLVQYFDHLGKRCEPKRQRRIAGMVGRLHDFTRAHALSGSSEPLWVAFPEALVGGTEHLTGPLKDLIWPPASPVSARARLGLLNGFLEWVSDRAGSPVTSAPWLDPLLTARRSSRRARHATLPYRAHTWDAHERGRASARQPVVIDRDAVAFDERHLEKLLFVGFRRTGALPEHGALSLDLKDVLITILQHGGGLRSCEAFHLFEDDIGIDPNDPLSAEVRLYHPEDGWAPSHAQLKRAGRDAVRREEYLREWYGRVSRNRDASGQHAGWKHLRLDRPGEAYSVVRWFPSEWGRVFLHLFNLYLAHQRPTAVGHPFLFVSDHGPERGQSYTLQSYRQAHAVAIRRIGLKVAKSLGTTPHGHRHAYGRRLAAAEVSTGVVQVAMHHRSPLSQLVYTAPTTREVADEIERLSRRLLGRFGALSEPSEDGGDE